jgi:hypothetical protein
MQTSQADRDEAARPILTESPIENENELSVNCDNNTGKPSGILISTEDEKTDSIDKHDTGNSSGCVATQSCPTDALTWSTGTGTTSTSGQSPAQSRTWTALLKQSMSILSGGGDLVSSDLDLIPHDFSPHGSSPRVSDVNGRDYFPDAERAGKHYSTDPGVCVSYIEPTGRALSTLSALHTQSMPILPGGSGEGSVSSDLIPHDDLNTDNHFITRFLRQTGRTTPMDGGSLIPLKNSCELLNIDQSFESFHTPPSSPCAETGDETLEVFVTPPPSPSAAGASLGPSIATAPYTSTLRQRLSDVFTSQVPNKPVPSVDPGRVPMTSATLVRASAGLSVNLGVDFIQINCDKRISAMALLETNAKNKIALIQDRIQA